MPVLTINGVRHYFRLEGRDDRAPLMLVHPIGADLSLWDKVVPLLTSRFQVLRLDLRGHGGTQSTPGDCTVEQLAGDLLAVGTAVGWQRFAVCGVSIGGMAAVQAAAQAPERITHLAVCSASPRMSEPPGGWDARAHDAREKGLAASADAMVTRMFSPAHRATGDPHIDTLRAVYARTDPLGYAGCIAVLRDADLRPVLGRVAAPALVITAEEDPLIPASAASTFLAGLKNARHIVLPGGHFPPVEQPAAFAEGLTSLLM